MRIQIPSDEVLEREMQKVEEKITVTEIPTKKSFRDFSLGQDFYEDVAFVTVPDTSTMEDGDMVVVTSQREKFSFKKEELLRRGLSSGRFPSPSSRWLHEEMERFLKGENRALTETYALLTQQLRHYLDLGDVRRIDYLACWILGTYFHRLFPSFPYIHLNGNKESGKTKCLTVLSLLAFNGELSVNSTAAYLTRCIHDNHAVICADEMEGFENSKDDGIKTLLAMYNSGYKRGVYTGKMESGRGGKSWTAKRYEGYSPKVFASINNLHTTLASRCVPITMLTSSSKELRNREVMIDDRVWQNIRDGLYSAMLTKHLDVRNAYQSLTDEDLVGREWELWKPILAIAHVVDPSAVLARNIRELGLDVIKEKSDSTNEDTVAPKLLLGLRELLISATGTEHSKSYTVEELRSYLVQYDQESFGWLKEGQKVGRWLGNEMRRAGAVKGRAVAMSIKGKKEKVFQLFLAIIEERLQSLGVPYTDIFGSLVTPAIKTEKPLENNGNQESNRDIPF